jgi:hypothetical protein
MLIIFNKRKDKDLVGTPLRVSPGPTCEAQFVAPHIAEHTLSSGNMHEARCLRSARVTFPQRLPVGVPQGGTERKRDFLNAFPLSHWERGG